MTKPIRTEPEADEELFEAVRWYEQRRRGLGLEFLAAIGAAVELIQRNPAGGSRVPGVKGNGISKLPPLDPEELVPLVAA